MISVKVKFKYGSPKGSHPSVTTQEVIMAEAKTESAVMVALEKKHPNWTIIIIKIE